MNATKMNKTNPTVTVVIPTYNRSKLLVQALESVLEQTRPPDETIVVDDGSSDDTAEVLKRFEPRIRHLRQENAGKPAALNLAMAKLNTDYLWIMDDDDVALPDSLERHLAFLAAHPKVDISYSDIAFFDGVQAPSPDSVPLDNLPGPPWRTFFISAMELYPCRMQSMLVPRTCFDAVGKFDEALTFGEDYDMILRLARRFRFAKLAATTVFVREHPGARGPAHERVEASDRKAGWRAYDGRIFARLRQKLSLSEYLPRSSACQPVQMNPNVRAENGAAEPLTDIQTRRALLQRACIMARHGLFAEALEDLDNATTIAPRDEPITQEERLICGRMLSVEPIWLAGQANFLRSVTRLLRRRAPALLDAAAAGLNWSLMRELRAGNRNGAMQMGRHLLRLAGPAGLAQMFSKKLLRRFQH